MPPRKRPHPTRKAVPPITRQPAPGPRRRRSPAGNRSASDVDGWWPPKSVPIAVEGGLQAKSQRGPIGESWWSGRFLAALESLGVGSRLQRGKNYARRGQVLSIEIAPGQVSASVQGSRARPYRVFIETTTLSASAWQSVEDAMAARASFVASLLAGEMPNDIEDAFAASDCSLFPDPTEGIDAACSCPDWENPCKHIAAVFYLLAEGFDTDPFLMFAWRGRDKEQLLDALRVRRRAGDATRARAGDADDVSDVSGTHGATSESSDAERDERVDLLGWPLPTDELRSADQGSALSAGFWRSAVDLSGIEVRPRVVAVPDLVLRQLDPAVLGRDSESILDQLRPMYETMVTSAMRSLDDERDAGESLPARTSR